MRFQRIGAVIAATAVFLLLTAEGCQPPPPPPPPPTTTTTTTLPPPPPTTTTTTSPPPPPAPRFVVRSGAGFSLGGTPWKFTGYDIYNAASRNNCGATITSTQLGTMLDRSGAGVIRVWFFAPLATSASGGRSWTAFDQVLATAKARNVRVIATLTDQWGACETTGYKYDSWYTSGYRTTYLPWISEVTAHYKANTEIAMWEIVNEPEMKTTSGTCGSATAFRAFAADASQRIRAADPNHLIGSGVIGGGQCGAAGDDYALLHAIPTIDVCSYHDYNHATQGMPGDQWNGLARRIAQCATLNKPIIVGELGIEVRELAQPTLSARADAFMAKVSASNTAGADGTLLWMLTEPPLPGTYDIGLTDPVVAPLATLSGRR